MIANRGYPTAGFLCLATWCALGGCSQHDRPATFPVRGRVTYQGKPVAEAAVAFLAPGAPRPAVGTTDQEGNFLLTTFERDDGAVIGTHTVTVRKLTSIPTGPYRGAPGDGEIDSAAIERARQETAKQIEAAKKSRSELPAKYADRTTSDLRKEVREGDNVIDIELAD